MYRLDTFHVFLVTPTRAPSYSVKALVPKVKAAAGCRLAVEESRARWPEFVAAFRARDGEMFSVKAPMHGGGNTEFIWIEVESLEDSTIRGKLGNDPVDLGGLKAGHDVRIAVADVNDWVFMRAGKPEGLFTPKVLEAIQDAAAGGTSR